MWNIKYFRTAAEQAKWMAAKADVYQMVVLFVNNGFAVEYKKLRRVY